MKKFVPTYRSSISSAKAPVRAGKIAIASTWLHSAVQQNTGIFIIVMPGARILMMVVTMLMADNVVPTPAICSAHR